MSGGKGGSSTSTVQIPEYIEKAAQRNLNKAEQISQIGYTPYYGPDVAAFSPTQQAAFQNTSNMAGAFGMAAPTSTGMPQAMDFGGGITGYSSAPLYENAVGQLQQNRPGQYNAIKNLFIDPYSGGAGSSALPAIDYTGFDTAAQAAARQAELDRQNQLAIAMANAGPDSLYYSNTVSNTNTSAPTYDYGGISYDARNQASTSITNPVIGADGRPVSTDPTSALTGIKNDVTEALTGATVGLFAPSYAVGGVNNPIETPTIGEMVNYAPTGMSYNPSTGGYERGEGSGGGNFGGTANAPSSSLSPPSQAAIDASRDAAGGGGGGGGDKVICTALHSLGLLPDDIYALDAQFGQRVNREDPALGDGYRLWATPVAEYIKGDGIGSKIALAVIKPLATAWAKQMAHTMRPEDYEPSLAGKIIMAVGHPTCRLIGNVFARQIAATKEA